MVRCVHCGEVLKQEKTKLGEEVEQRKKGSSKNSNKAKNPEKTEYEQFMEWKQAQEKPKGSGRIQRLHDRRAREFRVWWNGIYEQEGKEATEASTCLPAAG